MIYPTHVGTLCVICQKVECVKMAYVVAAGTMPLKARCGAPNLMQSGETI